MSQLAAWNAIVTLAREIRNADARLGRRLETAITFREGALEAYGAANYTAAGGRAQAALRILNV